MTVAIGEGTERAVQAKLRDIGENILNIGPDRIRRGGARQGSAPPRLTEDDGRALAQDSPNVVAVAPLLVSEGTAAFGGFTMGTQITGTTRSFFSIRVWPLTRGELWSEQAETTSARVCLLGANVASELFGSADPVGRTIRLGRYPFLVVGVLAKRSHGAFGGDLDTVVLMPVGTKRAKLQPTAPGSVQRLLVKARTENVIDQARVDVTEILRRRHQLSENEADDFDIRSDDSFRQMQQGIVGTLRLLLTSIAGVSLLVGGIGIMNIMLVSVSERTRDIGIRMAIGATRWDILVQFLTESVLLCLLGGLLGVAASVAGSWALGQAISIPMQASPDAVLLALGVSTTIGVVFGMVPSWRAASLDPIVALGRQ
jgi:putative ABC transport system permease protein